MHNFGADFGEVSHCAVCEMAKSVEGDVPPIPEQKFEYLDHTADVQLHAWGADTKEAFEQVAMAMFGYMTTNYDSIDMTRSLKVEASGNDMKSLLFQFLDEWLFAFSADEFFFPRVIKITEFDRENFHIKSVGWGEPFNLKKHPQGTEVKAITYSNMQIHDAEGHHEVFVIIDI
ncbi:Protein archease [Echinococcus granulosus]|uniref:Protein archease n=1 Tax=Echinococcus granulosus TaxID=6210 RepID=W6U228_ECHGR|nr:Protein archease [Echinococcus granulosus]EUB55160.1 Protein archease [Echinococcus granulosus]KAH9278247.1 Protein archease [Echinococcus granulosus]